MIDSKLNGDNTWRETEKYERVSELHAKQRRWMD